MDILAINASPHKSKGNTHLTLAFFLKGAEDAGAKTETVFLTLEDVISDASAIGYGTTVGTNIIVSGVGGPRLGLITTRGQRRTGH